jgi:hypothetical protein
VILPVDQRVSRVVPDPGRSGTDSPPASLGEPATLVVGVKRRSIEIAGKVPPRTNVPGSPSIALGA